MFNRMELLLCVIIGAVLMLLMVGAVNQKQARLAICNNNLRGILNAMTVYVGDYGVMPPVWTPKKPLWTFWVDNMDPTWMKKTSFTCPSDPRNSHMFTQSDPLFTVTKRIAVSSYGMNERMHTYNSKTRRATMNNFVRPEMLFIFGDAKIPMLQPVQNPGVPRHMKRYHYITASGAIKSPNAWELGGFIKGKLKYNPKNWNPWK